MVPPSGSFRNPLPFNAMIGATGARDGEISRGFPLDFASRSLPDCRHGFRKASA